MNHKIKILSSEDLGNENSLGDSLVNHDYSTTNDDHRSVYPTEASKRVTSHDANLKLHWAFGVSSNVILLCILEQLLQAEAAAVLEGVVGVAGGEVAVTDLLTQLVKAAN
eukprot:g40387.t1